jgi:hypothetical protein
MLLKICVHLPISYRHFFSFFFLQRSFWRLYNPSLAASFRYKLLMTVFDEDSDRLPIYSIEYYAFNPTHLLLAHR